MRQLSRPAGRARGMTLIELLIAMAITALLLAAATPMFGDYMANARLRSAGESLRTDALFAQSEAIKRNGTVRLVASGSTLTVTDRSETGLSSTLRTTTLPNGVTVDTATTLDFGSAGRPAPFGTEVTVSVGATGVTCSADYRCPALRVEAGGAVRLCTQKESCS